jgi:hypothetical protein
MPTFCFTLTKFKSLMGEYNNLIIKTYREKKNEKWNQEKILN